MLSADAGGHSTVGTQYAGPTWESNSGSTVVGTVFERVTFIQRVNTVGGTAPARDDASVDAAEQTGSPPEGGHYIGIAIAGGVSR